MIENASNVLRAAAVQFASSTDIDDNVKRIGAQLATLADGGVRVAAFPECAVTSYRTEAILAATQQQLERAEQAIADTCREHGIGAVVGLPYYEDGDLYNGALAWDATGRLVARYAKIQLAEGWPVQGKRFVLFRIDGVLCSIIVCHDERYPELVALPVLAGAQLVFYVSSESDATSESKVDPYRAQIQARAEENSVFIVHSNTPQMIENRENGDRVLTPGCSHGQSRIIAPDGNIMCEAPIFGEAVIVQDLDMNRATRHIAERSRQSPLLASWWEEGLKLVPPPEE